jgi:hypothetical protein
LFFWFLVFWFFGMVGQSSPASSQAGALAILRLGL